MSLFTGLSLWGTKKEYPSIISILIAILLPIIGFIFVGNQMKFKKDLDGKVHGLFLVSVLLCVIWWGALILFLVIVF